MSDNRKVIRIDAEVEEMVRDYAEEKGITIGEAADKLISTGVSRLTALKRYAKNREPMPPGKPRKKAAPKRKSKTTAKAKAKTATKKRAAKPANGIVAQA